MRTGLSALVFAVFLWGVCLPAALSAETMYVKTNGTKLRADASARAKVVTKLKIGMPVRVLKKAKRFYKVSVSGERGWIFRFKLTKKAPAAKQGGDSFADALGGRQEFGVRESASGSSIRGLSPASKKYAEGKGISRQNVQAVEIMENFSVSLDEVDAFLKEGQLGEYGF